MHLTRGRRFLWKIVDTLAWVTEGTGYHFSRSDILSMELGEVIYYFRRARQRHEELVESRRRGAVAQREGVVTESESWAQVESTDMDEDEDVSVETMLDE